MKVLNSWVYYLTIIEMEDSKQKDKDEKERKISVGEGEDIPSRRSGMSVRCMKVIQCLNSDQ
jgi:hypothetical protein